MRCRQQCLKREARVYSGEDRGGYIGHGGRPKPHEMIREDAHYRAEISRYTSNTLSAHERHEYVFAARCPAADSPARTSPLSRSRLMPTAMLSGDRGSTKMAASPSVSLNTG